MCLAISVVSAQDTSCVVSGVIRSDEGEVLPGVAIYLEETNYNTTSDDSGYYQLIIPEGTYSIIFSGIGFVKEVQAITVQAGQSVTLDQRLKYDTEMLNEVTVFGKSNVQKVKETAYNVVAIDARPLANRTVDLSQAMERTSGVRIRKTGGEGSKTSVMINGFTGKHVKIFLDGMPMNSFGSAFQINNIPINFADHIEIYKGVVPIELGADALGGAINIVTRKTANTFLDASYSYGSFNTHKSNINFGTTFKSGLTVHLNAFQNYSDNDYEVKTYLMDVETNQYNEEEKHWFRRFHDNYHNESVVAKIGFQQKSWADRFMLGVTYAKEYQEVQHANLMQIAYGGVTKSAETLAPSLEYLKENLFAKNLSLRVSATYSDAKNINADTLARQYNWAGEYVIKKAKGESGDYTLSHFSNKSGVVSANLQYKLGEKHLFAINNLYSTYNRSSRDEKGDELTSATDSIKKTNNKDVLGISYSYQISDKWQASIFEKNYFVSVTGPVDTIAEDSHASYVRKTKNFMSSGYGVITNYQLSSALLVKLSYEKSVRLPNTKELFGDELIETGSSALKPEISQNANVNLIYNSAAETPKDHSVYLESGFIYRLTKDYIRRLIADDGIASYENHGTVRTLGIEGEVHYFYKNRLMVGGNVTYQSILDMETKDAEGRESLHYKDPIPNTPIFFGHLDASYKFPNVFAKGNTLTLGYYLNYVDKFYKEWKSLGATSTKAYIPEQLSHDFSVTYVMKDGRYNLALEARNFTDEILYDNYSLQKPGRSFSAKLRYFFNRARK